MKKIVLNKQGLVMLFVAITLNMKVNGDKDKTISIEEYLDKIRRYLSKMILKSDCNLPKNCFIWFIESSLKR